VLNELDRFHLVATVIDRVPGLAARAADVTAWLSQRLVEHKRYIRAHGEDMPDIRDWKWDGGTRQAGGE
jgi:xylulose-5-phosphate/fructose-6-phosphate phosphoketolase